MSYTKKKLEELNVIDDFLMNRLASDAAVGEEFCRLLLSTLLQREIGKVKVTVQKMMPPLAPDRKGVRMDVMVEEAEDAGGEADAAAMCVKEMKVCDRKVYDIEPHLIKGTDTGLARRNRFYQALTDSGRMKRGQKDYRALPDLYVVTILDEDPFGYDYMAYSIRNRCEEVEELAYEDGLHFYYFYTQGNQGGSERIKTMLRYIGDSRKENVADEATGKLHAFTESVKIQPEVRESYMLWEEYEDMMREEGRKEGRKEGEPSGKIEESKATVFDLLKDKGEIPPDTAGRINGEEDLQILRKWVRLAAKTDSIAGFEAEM